MFEKLNELLKDTSWSWDVTFGHEIKILMTPKINSEISIPPIIVQGTPSEFDTEAFVDILIQKIAEVKDDVKDVQRLSYALEKAKEDLKDKAVKKKKPRLTESSKEKEEPKKEAPNLFAMEASSSQKEKSSSTVETEKKESEPPESNQTDDSNISESTEIPDNVDPETGEIYPETESNTADVNTELNQTEDESENVKESV